MLFIIGGVLMVLVSIFIAVGWIMGWDKDEMLELLAFVLGVLFVNCLIGGGINGVLRHFPSDLTHTP